MNKAEKKTRELYEINKKKDIHLLSDQELRKQVFDQDAFYRIFNERSDKKMVSRDVKD